MNFPFAKETRSIDRPEIMPQTWTIPFVSIFSSVFWWLGGNAKVKKCFFSQFQTISLKYVDLVCKWIVVESNAFHLCGNANACWTFPHWFMFRYCFNQLVWGCVTFWCPLVAGVMPWRIPEFRRDVDSILVLLDRKNYGCSLLVSICMAKWQNQVKHAIFWNVLWTTRGF